MATLLDLPEVRARVTRWTVADYERLIELGAVSRRAELLRGLIVEKMLESPLHEFPTDNIAENLRRLVREGLLVRQEASLRLADSVPEPDVAVVRGRAEDFRTRHPTTAELVVEVAVSSVALDRENASLYAEAGVAEYWIVLGESGQVETYRRPENGVYQERRTYSRDEAISCPVLADEPVFVAAWFA